MRMEFTERRATIVRAALYVSERKGYNAATRSDIAKRAKCAPATVQYYFPSMADLRAEVMRVALRDGILPIIAQGVVMRDRAAASASKTMRRAALLAML